jgi:hypothetical protein
LIAKARWIKIDTDFINEFSNGDCGVNEEMFPCPGKCCRKSNGIFMVSYEKICPHCDVMTSLPYGNDLKMVTMIECLLYGYDKRVIE